MSASRQRIGLVLFAIYLIVYGGFVLLNAFAPHLMQWKPMSGVNLAVAYGFGLILSAFGLAVVYGFVSRNPGTERKPEADHRERET
jgi:uncharacterized membrane protein (DUF485 family)